MFSASHSRRVAPSLGSMLWPPLKLAGRVAERKCQVQCLKSKHCWVTMSRNKRMSCRHKGLRASGPSPNLGEPIKLSIIRSVDSKSSDPGVKRGISSFQRTLSRSSSNSLSELNPARATAWCRGKNALLSVSGEKPTYRPRFVKASKDALSKTTGARCSCSAMRRAARFPRKNTRFLPDGSEAIFVM